MTSKKLFGTNGIRGEIGDNMNPKLVMDIGRAIGTIASKKGKSSDVMIATDTRYSAPMLKSSIAAGILSTGCLVLDAGILSTPALQYGVKNSSAVMGVMLTASHNPPEYNGIKCIAGDGTETSAAEEKDIEDIYHRGGYYTSSWRDVRGILERNDINNMYIQGILDQVDREKISKRGFKVVLDCANGATFASSPVLLEKLETKLITLNAQPSGGFPAHSSEPVEENISDAMELVKVTGADLGVAHDGDGDRSIFIDEKGRYILGDKMLALVAGHMVSKNKGGIVVTAINTSSVLEDVVREEGGTVVYTPIGSPIVAREMMQRKAVFGGEENGGLIFPKHQYCRDGAMAVAAVLEMMLETGEKLSEMVDSLPEYHLVKLKFKYPVHLRNSILSKYLELVQDLKPSTLDGIKVQDDEGWVLLRPSGTEAIYRIQVEDKDIQRSKSRAEETKKILLEIIESLS